MWKNVPIFAFLGASFLFASAPEQTATSKSVIKTIHRIRHFIEAPEKVIPADRELVKAQVEALAQNEEGLKEFAKYLYGPGLLYLDEFYEDLAFLLEAIQRDDGGGRLELQALGFFPFAQLLAKVSLGEPLASVQSRWDDFEVAATAVLLADNRFHETAGVIKGRVKIAQSVLLFGAAGYTAHLAWNLLGLSQMTPREIVGLLLSVWAGNEALFWIVWDRFQWMDTISKAAGKTDYGALTEAWTKLLALDPELTAQKAASAATTKLISNQRRSDPHADAALEALLKGIQVLPAAETSAMREELFEMFLSELEDGNASRSLKVLIALQENAPDSRAARMSAVVARIFKLRQQIERTCLVRESLRASVRLAALGLAVFGSNSLLKSLLPNDLQQWRMVPNWILAGLGVRRIFPHVWKPHRLESLRQAVHQQEGELRAAFRELRGIDPSGELIERIVKYDSGAPAHRLVGFAAGDALAEDPNGERTRKLWNIISWELSTPHPSGSRVQDLLSNTFSAQRRCVSRLIEVFQRYESTLPGSGSISP